jgi:hypothetical protein
VEDLLCAHLRNTVIGSLSSPHVELIARDSIGLELSVEWPVAMTAYEAEMLVLDRVVAQGIGVGDAEEVGRNERLR